MRKNILQLIISLLIGSIFSSCNNSERLNLTTVTFQPDTTSFIRNPGMGWTIYDDANDHVADAETFWEKQDSIARKYATSLYIRWRWSDMEPEEGKYAWDHDPNFQALVKGALDRGLKLAFRVYVSGQDNQYESTPNFVFDAGAKFCIEQGVTGKVRSPYYDDLIFQEKFENFIKAFALKFDEPEIVNYVDGYNLGWWGEGHNLKFTNPNNCEDTFKWITKLYGNAFKQVPLIITIDSQIGHEMELKYAILGQGYSVRRDGYASFWMPDRQKAMLKGLFPKCFVVAECCYWQDKTIESINKIDKKYNWDSWADYYKQVVDEALETHANYLDLREPVEASRWASEANKEVQRFLKKGGYRIYPVEVKYNKAITKGDSLSVEHSWANIGVGIMPNNSRAWNKKYKVAFDLLNSNGQMVKRWTSEKADVSELIFGKVVQYSDKLIVRGIKKGNYTLRTAIVNSQTNKAEVQLAVHKHLDSRWISIGEVILK